jgi:hypothetical protein
MGLSSPGSFMLGRVFGGREGGGAAGWAGLLLPIHEDALVQLSAADGLRMEIVGRGDLICEMQANLGVSQCRCCQNTIAA